VRLAVKVVMDNDGEFVDVILLYQARGKVNAMVYARAATMRVPSMLLHEQITPRCFVGL
jgi:hypothetical protein